MKLLLDRWGQFRKEALARQDAIVEALMQLQRREFAVLKDWMTATEDKISRIGNQSLKIEDVDNQLEEHRLLKAEFEVRTRLFCLIKLLADLTVF